MLKDKDIAVKLTAKEENLALRSVNKELTEEVKLLTTEVQNCTAERNALALKVYDLERRVENQSTTIHRHRSEIIAAEQAARDMLTRNLAQSEEIAELKDRIERQGKINMDNIAKVHHLTLTTELLQNIIQNALKR